MAVTTIIPVLWVKSRGLETQGSPRPHSKTRTSLLNASPLFFLTTVNDPKLFLMVKTEDI